MTTRKITGKGMMVKKPAKKSPLMDEEDLSRDALIESRIDSFNSYCDPLPEGAVFDIDSPVSLPVETKAGYRTKSFIGGESFVPTGAYIGKAGKVIYVFRPFMISTEFQTIEVASDKVLKVFPRFGDWLREVESELDDMDRKEAQKRAEEIERKAHDAAQTEALLAAKQKDDRYGSW